MKYVTLKISKFIVCVYAISMSLGVLAATDITHDFNTSSDFTGNFVQSSPATGTFTWGAASGLSSSGGISISLGSDQVWTTKEAYTIAANGVYTMSAFMYSAGNNGYGALGLSVNNPDSNAGMYGAPSGAHVGVFFHGGGGGFLNNGPISTSGVPTGSNQIITWSNGGLSAAGVWYQFVFTVTAKGSNKFDLNLKIYNATSAGVVGSLVTEHTMTDDVSNSTRVGPAVTNALVGGAPAIRTFFSAEGTRMTALDDFRIQLSGDAAYIAPALTPTVTSVSPSSGSIAGGASITITGTDFTGATGVKIGGAACTNVTVVDSSTITCTTPAGTAGTASVLVTTLSGGTNASNTLFTYAAAPTVTAVSPTAGSTVGSTSITITGTGFTGATGVTIGGAACTNVTVVDSSTITCTTPAGTAGTASVLVTTPVGGTNAANTLFTYVSAPTVTAVAPTAGLTAGGTSITITGAGFTGATGVTIGGAACTNVTVVNSSTITCTTPVGTAGTASVLVTTSVGGTNAANTLFTYVVPIPAPIPTLGEWAMLLLASLMAMVGITKMRRR